MGWTLVTGGAKGLGAEISRKLVQEGHKVVVHYRTSRKDAEELAASCGCELIQGDFSTADGVAQFIQDYCRRFADTHYLVNNVGNYLIKPSLATSVDDLSMLYQTNLFAPFALTQALLPGLKSVVNIGAAGLNSRADAYSTAYTMTKSGLLQWTRSLAKELAPSLTSVNMVSPGYIEDSIDLPEHFPMSRPATRIEVAGLVAFLLDEPNRYITGQNIEVAGGVRL